MKAFSAAFSALLATSLAHSTPQYRLTEIASDGYHIYYEMNGINAYGDIVGTWTVDTDGPHAQYLQHSTGASLGRREPTVSVRTVGCSNHNHREVFS